MSNKRTLTIQQTAKLLDKPPQSIRLGLQRGAFSFGSAWKGEGKEFIYVVYRKALENLIGEIKDEDLIEE